MIESLNDMQRPSMLIVSDKEDAGSYQSLKPQGARVVALDFHDCVDYIKHMKVDVVLLDCGHRVWTGLSTLRQIKQACPDIAVVFLTDQGSEDVAINALAEGAKEYFRKPADLYEVKQILERLLAVRRASDGGGPPIASPHPDGGAPCTRTGTSDKPENLLQVIAFIEENLLSSMELGSLAKQAHLSKFHFCRVFKRHIGMNPMKFVAALRIERAKELLTKNDKTVSLVANEVGFRDLSNFIRQFKKITGVTPTTYRNLAKEEEASLN
jgi:YesN/AraC family two-component response regulator